MISARIKCIAYSGLEGGRSVVKSGEVFNFHFGKTTLVGRSNSFNKRVHYDGRKVRYLNIQANTIARRQCVFKCNLDGILIEDLGAAHPVEVNGRKLKKRQRSRLYNGDYVKLGHMVFLILIPKILRMICYKGKGLSAQSMEEALLRACIQNNTRLVKSLLSSGCSPDGLSIVGSLGGTMYRPIHESIRKGNLDMVKLLIEAGANINLPIYLAGDACYHGVLPSTPLNVACEHNMREIELYLLKLGAVAARPDLDAPYLRMLRVKQQQRKEFLKTAEGKEYLKQEEEREKRNERIKTLHEANKLKIFTPTYPAFCEGCGKELHLKLIQDGHVGSYCINCNTQFVDPDDDKRTIRIFPCGHWGARNYCRWCGAPADPDKYLKWLTTKK